MRAAIYYSNANVRIEEVPLPQLGPGELLLRVEASGICGSDVMEWYRLPKAPLILGHEIAGKIHAVGDSVQDYKVGDRVMVTHHVPCNTCASCLRGNHTACDTLHRTSFDPGGFAEYVRIPAINVDRGTIRLDSSVSYEQATFIEPLGCAIRGLRVAGGLTPGDTILIVGSGLAGLQFVQLCSALGAGKIIATDISEFRLNAATNVGADGAIDAAGDVPALVRRLNGGRGADLAIICSGAPAAIGQALASVARAGRVLLFAPPAPGVALPIDLNTLWDDGITLSTTYAASPSDLAEAHGLIRSRRVRPEELISHRLPLSETALGFRLTAQADQSLKVIIQPNQV
ncbi:MAG: alcohol dehydrogenase catalytic domain-containing protein [Chloroflexi bacterium]|nr:alcohol dehydrogenase catalytic domain-containing protein [Chloroflexota bacterium]